jgi:hypothetical protein
METLQISKANALEAYDEASSKVKVVLEKLFGKNIMEVVKSWEDVCELNDTDPVKCLPFPSPSDKHQEAVNGFFKMTIIADALNEGWVPDWENSNEYKYCPWFKHSGGGFSFDICGCANAYSFVGARLVFKSRQLAEYAGNQFLEIYKSFHTK